MPKSRSSINIKGFKEEDKLDFWNFDEIIKSDPAIEQLEYVQNESYLPQHPFRLIINGGSGTGKTNQLLNLLFHDTYSLNYHKVYLYAHDLSEPKYEYLIKKFENIADDMRVPVEEIFEHSDKMNEIIDVDDLDKKKMNLVIFDDLVNEKNQDKIKELYLRGRKKNADMIYLSQYYHLVPKLVRKNVNYVIFFRPNTSRETNVLYTDFGIGNTKSFAKLVDDATDGYNFLFIDIGKKKKELKYRKGYLNLSKWEEE